MAYEVQCRLCDAACIRARGWDHTTYGSISTTLAAARLGHLDHDQTLHALGIAGTTGTALRLTRSGELSMWKGCAFAFAARNGVFAAQLASLGMTGPSPALRRRDGVHSAGFRPVRSAQAGRAARRRLDAPEDLDQVRPGRVSLPVGDRRGLRASSRDRRPPADPVHRDRHLPHGRRDHRQGPREVASREPARPPTTAFPTASWSPSWTARSRPTSSLRNA